MTAAMRGSGKSESRDEIIRAQASTPVMDPEECWKSLEDKILAGNIAMDMGRVRAAYEFEGPVYMRFGRLATPVINDHEDYEFKIGRGVVVREGSDVTIIACGLMVAEALEAAEALAADGIDAEVINMHTIKPLDERLVVASAKKTGRVVTAEEHSIIGGLGEAVASVLAEQHPVPMRRVGVRDVYGESGPAVDLLHKYGLDADGIEAAVRSVL